MTLADIARRSVIKAPPRPSVETIDGGFRVRIGLQSFVQFAFVGCAMTVGGFLTFAGVTILQLAISGGFKAWGIG